MGAPLEATSEGRAGGATGAGAIADHLRIGSGEPVLLIHGFTATWRAWGPIPERLASEGFEVLAVTIPGHTGGPPLGEGDSIPALVRGLEAMLDEVGWGDAHVAGFSLGGWLSLELAKLGRARSVTAIAPGGGKTEQHDRESRRIQRLFGRLHRGAKLVQPWAEELNRRPRYRKLALRDQMVDGSRVPPRDAYELTKAFVDTPVFHRFLREIGDDRAVTLEDLDRIDCPVTVLWGERDAVLPMRRHAPFFRESLPAARFEVLPNAGHVPFWEATDAVVAAIAAQARRPS
jgi:pimeloyl-ACP methyl ester carboxylesterase